MRDYLKVIGVVRLGDDAELRDTKSGKKVANFRGASNRSRDKENRQTAWIGFRLWNKFAEATAPYLNKGRTVLVDGTIPMLPKPSDKGNVNRCGAEAFFTKESREVVKAILNMVAAGHEKTKDADKVINGILSQVSTQVVVNVNELQLLQQPKGASDSQGVAETAEVADDDNLPF